MKIVDLNILLYAINPSFEQHHVIHQWWENALNGEESVGLPWVVLSGFIRISTNPRVFSRPLAVAEALRKLNCGSSSQIL